MRYSIQRLSTKDIDEITEEISDAIKKDFPQYKKKTSYAYLHIFNRDFFIKFFNDNKKHIFGAFLKNKLVGFICFKEDFGGVIFVHWLVVKREFRKRGVDISIKRN